MKTTRFTRIICLFAFFLTANSIKAQVETDTTALYRIETLNGNEYNGNIIRQDSTKIYLKEQKIGEISILKTEVRHIDKLDASNMIEGKFWFENPQSGRYFWAPNGHGLKAGEGYYQNVWVLYNQASVGITDYISVGAGMIPLFFFGGASTPVWIVPKVSIPVVTDKINLGAGGIIGTVLGEEDAGFGILYGVSTFGNRNNNFNIGIGYGYAGGEWAKSPLINISAMIRTGSKSYLITENYYIATADIKITIISFGGRSIIKRAASIDYGLFVPITAEIDNFVAFPWLGITVPFGKKPELKQIPGR